MSAHPMATPGPQDGDAIRRLSVRDTVTCPGCRTSSAVMFGARCLCGQCGNQWQLEPVGVRTGEQDAPGTASRSIYGTPRYGGAVGTSAERTEVQRRAKLLADRTHPA